jgi:Fur family transcriptional regulator, ferric uptake regulator
MKEKLPENFDEVRKIFTAYLEFKQHRKTPERYAILKEIYTVKGHFDIETLYTKMKNDNYRVSRATLYNTIELLLDCNLVIRHQFGKNSSQYEKSYKFGQHDHVICIDNQQIIEFCDPRIQDIQRTLEKTFHLEITHHSLTFYARGKEENK